MLKKNTPLHILFLISFLVFPFIMEGQFNKEIFKWESHLPLQIGKQIAQSQDKIFYATDFSIVSIDKEEYHGEFISTVEGLSETGISKIAYDQTGEQLIIAYENGNIDFLQSDGSIINVADFKNNITFTDKTINKIIITEDRRAIYATRFGVISQSLETYLFEFTTNMEKEVFELARKDTTFYAATSDGLYKLDEKEQVNQGDFSFWQLLDGDFGLPAIYSCSDIEVYNNDLFAIIDNQVYKSNESSQWEILLSENSDHDYVFLSAEGSSLLIGRNNNGTTELIRYDESGISISPTSCANSMIEAIEATNGSIWYTDNWHGLRHQGSFGADCSSITYNSPYSEKSREIRIKNSAVYIASGGINEVFHFESNRDGFFVKENNNWQLYNGNTVPEIDEYDMININISIAHPSKDIIYAGAIPGGVLEINKETNITTVYNSENSPIKGSPGTSTLERVVELQFDKDENLWVITYGADKPLHVLTPKGIWHSFSFGNIKNLGAMEFDDFGKLWFQLAGTNGGVLVFDHNESLSDPTDDDYHKMNTSNTVMLSNKVYCLKKDLDGDIWVGTQNGPVIFECGNIFPQKNCQGSLRKVLQDSIPAPLLETEAITSISVDGANRKWLGSSTGIYVQSSNGEDQVLRITENDSPLFDNAIIDIEYDPILGEMYIATIKGVQSLRIDATGATKYFSSSNLYSFPNPVRPEYQGSIAIRGLARDANVKITDIQGRLVYETIALGGQAIWDGKDYNGKKAVAGVYVVYATYKKNLTQISTETTKILIME